MIAKQWKIKPPIDTPKDGIWLGAGKPGNTGIWLGWLAEAVSGKRPKVFFSTSKEQVIAVVGKRGSGKSFTLGVIAESLGSVDPTAQSDTRAVLLFDPLDVYWTTRYPVSSSSNAEAERLYKLAEEAGIEAGSVDVRAWVPGVKNRRPTDPDWFETLRLPVSAMDLAEWEPILGVNLISEPMGQAFAEAIILTRETGFHFAGQFVDPTPTFDLSNIRSSVRSEELNQSYHQETLRALNQRLSAMDATGLFSATGCSMEELVAPGRVCVILLSRLPQDYREAIVAILTRMLISRRSETAFAEKRLALDPELSSKAQDHLESAIENGVPKTVVVLDEAQSFLAPGRSGMARNYFIRLVKEGRNIGLSAVLATQQPSALDQRILSQVETFIAHQLVTEADIRAVRENLKSSLPNSIAYGATEQSIPDLLRQVPAGVCLVSAADMNTKTRRSIVCAVRPRATVHGGIEL